MNQAMMLECKPALLVSDEVHHELRLRGLSSHLLFSFSENSGTTVLLFLNCVFLNLFFIIIGGGLPLLEAGSTQKHRVCEEGGVVCQLGTP